MLLGCLALCWLADETGSELSLENQALLGLCSAQDRRQLAVARQRIRRINGEHLVAGLVELLRFCPQRQDTLLDLLRDASGHDLSSYEEGVVYLGTHSEVSAYPSYPQLKATLYASIDPAFAEFFAPDLPASIRLEEIVWGGVLKDGFGSLIAPATLLAADADYLSPEDWVFGVVIDGQARAYPQRIMDRHEMANDRLAGVPFALAYCTLCGSAIGYRRDTPQGVLTFGSSGLLYRSNKLMFDQQTNTLWNHLSGQPVLGTLAESRIELKVLPVQAMTWRAWRQKYPDSTVLDLDTGFDKDYRAGTAYQEYRASSNLMFPVWNATPDEAYALKDEFWLARFADCRKAYALKDLGNRPVWVDHCGGHRLLLIVDGTERMVLGYDLGALEVFQREGSWWIAASDGSKELLDRVQPRSPDGSRLQAVPGHRLYYFALKSFMPDVPIFESDDAHSR